MEMLPLSIKISHYEKWRITQIYKCMISETEEMPTLWYNFKYEAKYYVLCVIYHVWSLCETSCILETAAF